jgi:hypothetical protein
LESFDIGLDLQEGEDDDVEDEGAGHYLFDVVDDAKHREFA